jgi:hypothetical protein
LHSVPVTGMGLVHLHGLERRIHRYPTVEEELGGKDIFQSSGQSVWPVTFASAS